MSSQTWMNMEPIKYELLNHRIEPDTIESAYFADNKLFYTIEKTTKGNQVSFFNPEFAFEKQHLENADAGKVFTYLQTSEKYPEQYRQFLKDGFVFIKIDYADLSRLVRHIID